jgi:hypothetical protein
MTVHVAINRNDLERGSARMGRHSAAQGCLSGNNMERRANIIASIPVI